MVVGGAIYCLIKTGTYGIMFFLSGAAYNFSPASSWIKTELNSL